MEFIGGKTAHSTKVGLKTIKLMDWVDLFTLRDTFMKENGGIKRQKAQVIIHIRTDHDMREALSKICSMGKDLRYGRTDHIIKEGID